MGSLGLSQLPEDSTPIMASLINQFGARDFYPSVRGVEQDLLPLSKGALQDNRHSKRLHDFGARLHRCQTAWMIFPPRMRRIPLLLTKAKTMHTRSRFIISWYAAYNGIRNASFDFSPLLKSLMPTAPLIPRMVKGSSPYVRRNHGKLLPSKKYCSGRDAMKSRANGLNKHSIQAFKTQGFPSLAAHL